MSESPHEQLLSSLPLPDDEWTRQALARGMPPAIAMKLPHLPDSPGVYLWKAAAIARTQLLESGSCGEPEDTRPAAESA